ncbi:MAG: hypothetical protein HRF50_04560 [Phycisphaerae bacterium]
MIPLLAFGPLCARAASPPRHQHALLLIPDALSTPADWQRSPALIQETGITLVILDCALWSRDDETAYLAPALRDQVIRELQSRGRIVGLHFAPPTHDTDHCAWLDQAIATARALPIAPPLRALYADGAERFGRDADHPHGRPREYVERLRAAFPALDRVESSSPRETLDLLTCIIAADVPPAAECASMSETLYNLRLRLHLLDRLADVQALRSSTLLAGSGYGFTVGWIGGVTARLDEPMRLPWSDYWRQAFAGARQQGAGLTVRLTLEALLRLDRAAFRAALESRQATGAPDDFLDSQAQLVQSALAPDPRPAVPLDPDPPILSVAAIGLLVCVLLETGARRLGRSRGS